MFTPAVRDPTAIITAAGKRLSVEKPTIRQSVRASIIPVLRTLAPRRFATKLEMERDPRMRCFVFTYVATISTHMVDSGRRMGTAQ